MLLKSTLLLIVCFTFVFQASHADERKFNYVYQSNVLNKGHRDLEVWTTGRIGKNTGYYAALDHRVEFEIGLSKKLQSAFYLNFSQTKTDKSGTMQSFFEFQGISTEWKYQVSNPYTDAVGFGLYSELSLNTDRAELETKLIFDKKIGKTTLALNVTAEPEWDLGLPSDLEFKQENAFGLSNAISNNFSAGFEIRQHNVFVDGELEHSSLFGGPVLSYTEQNWFVNLTVLPQLAAMKKINGQKLDLVEYEKLEMRLLLSFAL